jgi:DNA-binding NarL/FixJ family response regulator
MTEGIGSIEVGVVESDEAFRRYLTAIIRGTPGLNGTFSCGTGKEALTCLAEHRPDLLIVNVFLKDQSGTDLIFRARELFPQLPFLLLIPEGAPNLSMEALESGARAYLPKPCAPEVLVQAIRTVSAGGVIIASCVAKSVVDYFRARGSVARCLTPREREVLACLASGLTQANAAMRLGIDHDTVRTHVRNLLLRLNAHSIAEAIAAYLNPGHSQSAAANGKHHGGINGAAILNKPAYNGVLRSTAVNGRLYAAAGG